MSNVFIGGAWPYANGSLHLGRLSSVLPGDVLARYFRSKGITYYMYQAVIAMAHP